MKVNSNGVETLFIPFVGILPTGGGTLSHTHAHTHTPHTHALDKSCSQKLCRSEVKDTHTHARDI